jgi:CheY-like chemotaxis protein
MVMDRQLDQLVRLVDDLLDVSRITRGKIQLQKAACELAPIVQAAIETSRPEIEAGRHELAVTFPAEPIMLDADATRLAQVFSNLLNNAAKYTPPGGRIAIEAERAGASATVRVTDTGIGIPSDMLSGIFDMFTQVDRSIEKTHGGLGIGLTLAKRLIEMHGGTIAASSDGPGTGSEFTVSLPARLGAAALAAPGEAPQPSLVRLARRILVVDDNADAVECLAEMLRVQGHEVATAHDGVAAIDLAGEFRPDVVLLDIGMPRLSGYETARRLRGIAPGALLVAVTGWGQEEHRRRSREVGFDHHLVKPVDPADLDALLAQAFDQT